MCIETRCVGRIGKVKPNHANRGRDKLSHHRQASNVLVRNNRQVTKGAPYTEGAPYTNGAQGTKGNGALLLLIQPVLAVRWLLGLFVGTLLVAITSPWFTRSYLPLVVDPVRQTWVLSPGSEYRWRSEGYANTAIGPMGLPGKTRSLGKSRSLVPRTRLTDRSPFPRNSQSDVLRIAMWGDSQVEGVCLDDKDKLFAMSEHLCGGAVEVFPLARSGQDAADWVTQIPAVEESLKIDLHLVVLADLEDVLAAVQAPLAPPTESDVAAANAAIAARFPAFIIQAARNLLTEDDGVSRRRLRFGVGPVNTEPVLASNASNIDSLPGHATSAVPQNESVPQQDWDAAFYSLKQVTGKPIWVFDAPVSPQIVDGRVQTQTIEDPSFVAMKRAAIEHGVMVLSARERFREEASAGRWPHGFQNGRIGSGHLNAHGNRLIAEILVKAIEANPIRPSSLQAGLPSSNSALGD